MRTFRERSSRPSPADPERRRFLALLVLGGAAQILASCGDQFSAGPGSDAGDCLSNGASAAISSNHGHSLTVPKEDVIAGNSKSYSISGSAGHSHTVTLGASDFASLQSNQGIVVTTDVDLTGHTHSVTITCA